MAKTKIKIYTDGSASPNPGPGGGGVVVIELNKNRQICYYGSYREHTTNNAMELLALLQALKIIKEHYPNTKVRIYTDSKYAISTVKHWAKQWKRNNWYTATGNPIKNRDIVEPLYDLYLKIRPRVIIRWVRGHNGDKYNEVADRLANKARDTQSIDWIIENTI